MQLVFARSERDARRVHAVQSVAFDIASTVAGDDSIVPVAAHDFDVGLCGCVVFFAAGVDPVVVFASVDSKSQVSILGRCDSDAIVARAGLDAADLHAKEIQPVGLGLPVGGDGHIHAVSRLAGNLENVHAGTTAHNQRVIARVGV